MEPTPTYHVDIWTVPDPTYSCNLCIPTQRYTLEAVTQHLREVHDADAIPPSNLEALLQIRYDSDARTAEAAAPPPSPPPPAPGPPPAAPAPHEPAPAGETPAAAPAAAPKEAPHA